MGESWNSGITATSPQTSKRSFRLAHQTLCINHIDFEQRLVVGFTQLIIWPTSTSLKRIHLNCRQCRIHRILLEVADPDPYTLDGNLDVRCQAWSKLKSTPLPTDLPIVYTDPAHEICKRDTKLRTLDCFQRAHASVVSMTDPDEDAGEVTIRLPPEFWPLISQKLPIRITLEFSLSKPKSGFYFVVPEGEGSLSERSVHAFTSFTPNSARLWFPCLDCSEPCTWKIEVTVFEDLIAIASGELIDAPHYTEDLTHKTYHFYVSQPVSAPYIGLAVGAFEIYPDPRLTNGTTHFCPPGLLDLLKHTVSPFVEIVEYYESILASQHPFSTMKAVFVDCAFHDFQSFSSLIIFSLDLLHSKRIIDQAIETRKVMSVAVASQFFGCFLAMHTWFDAWLPYGIAGYLSGLYQKRVFGNNEYRKIISDEMQHVTNFENTKFGIVLDASKKSVKTAHFNLNSPHLFSPDYLVAYIKKSHLVIRMLELRLGQPVLLQVLNKLLVLARLATKSIGLDEQSPDNELPNSSMHSNLNSIGYESTNPTIVQHSNPNSTNRPPHSTTLVPPFLSDEHHNNLLMSTCSFRRIISMVTGQDIQNFLDQWVYHSGHLRLMAKFHFNRKRNVVELELKQDLQARGSLNYAGPLTVMLQELDGAFIHTFKLEEGRMSRDLPCHSKSRKHRKKKIPLANGDEVDMDLGRIDSESPLLWISLDPDLAVIHHSYIDQPDYMWHLMLVHNPDCVGQLEAVKILKEFPSAETKHALSGIILNERIFYHIRMEACDTLCHVVNELSSISSSNQTITSNVTTSYLLPMFWQLFSSPAMRGLIKQNDFTNLQHYFLQRSMIRAFARLRIQQVCPREILVFLTDLLHHNDNSRNCYSDCYYVSDLVKSMRDTLTPAIIVRGVLSASSLPFEARTVVEEVVHLLNLETETPSYKNMVTVACLSTIRRLQRLGFLPTDSGIFRHYTCKSFYWTVRLAAIEALVDYSRGERDQSTLDWLFTQVIEYEDPNDAFNTRFRFETIQLLQRTPPFQRGETGSRLDTPQLVERLWNLMNYTCNGDSRIRCALASLYYTLYRNRRPACLPLPEGVLLVRVKEGRSLLNMTDGGSHMFDKTFNDLHDTSLKTSADDFNELTDVMYTENDVGQIPNSMVHKQLEDGNNYLSNNNKYYDDDDSLERGDNMNYFSHRTANNVSNITGNIDTHDCENVTKRRTQRLSDDEDEDG